MSLWPFEPESIYGTRFLISMLFSSKYPFWIFLLIFKENVFKWHFLFVNFKTIGVFLIFCLFVCNFLIPLHQTRLLVCEFKTSFYIFC